MPSRPGVKKVRRPLHVAAKTRSFVRVLDGAMGAWLDVADIISEGAVSADGEGRETYFGSTSIILTWASADADFASSDESLSTGDGGAMKQSLSTGDGGAMKQSLSTRDGGAIQQSVATARRAALPALLGDPHLRVRALRVARREAQARAGSDLSVIRADYAARSSERGVVVTIDVEALLVRGTKLGKHG